MRRQPLAESAREFVGAEENAGLVVWVDGMSSEAWCRWRPFVEDFSHASRNSSGLQPRLCIPVGSDVGEDIPERGAGVRALEWRGVVDRLDMSLFVRTLPAATGVSEFIQTVLTSVAVELAGSDPMLAVALRDVAPAALLQPLEPMTGIARQRNWSSKRSDDDWRSGAVECWEGRVRRHSLACAVLGDDVELRRRVWKGEVGVLFPLVEELRTDMVDELKRYWRLPLETPFGAIHEPFDLEISHMLLLAQRHRAPSEVIRLLQCLTEMRHALAHLRVVPLAQLKRPELELALARFRSPAPVGC
jgi:hypothetical protein